jgi:hypothetical protein
MTALFTKKGSGKTLAIVDIESGSVGAALVHLSPQEAPMLFAETRVTLPLMHTRDADALAREVERATEEALLQVSTVATQLRRHDTVSYQGDISRAAVFLAAPWARMHLSGGTADFIEPVRRSTHFTIRATLGEIPTSFHPLGTAAAHGSVLLFPDSGATIICIVGAEVSELILVSEYKVVGRATIPLGSHALLRTLISHSGMSPAEARSFVSLPRSQHDELHEPLRIAGDDFALQIEDAARDLMGLATLSGVLVVAHEPAAELIARALTRNQTLAEIFPDGGVVRAARSSHAMPFIAAHAKNPDLHLMLEALFVDAKFGGI